ncbi:SOS response-associated peptidase [Methylotuvimicrobium buryatense]|uniref:Abasic site processing protein n=1 Tax=Methylotuvimicrobium buryatense TaxID=95641 RepID=A0A4V1IJX6_METBY|nr:SOS response-associated peptidase [Methylotuvimicrobium buryatense]QCW82935.1 SOS response-associated peptidase [Methylotuvimicrobium buryatense]
MCGRFNLITTSDTIIEHFRLKRLPNYRTDYNIPPGQKILNIVQLEDGSNKGVYLHWGLIPSWSKDSKIANRLINARAETLADKPSFRSAYSKRRCLIPATGFYEWQQTETGKQPYHVHFPDNRLFAFAGLWEHWENGNETIYSCTIITCPALAPVSDIHERMPVIINLENYGDWLDKRKFETEVLAFDQAICYQQMELTPVSQHVNNPVHNDEACIQPIQIAH